MIWLHGYGVGAAAWAVFWAVCAGVWRNDGDGSSGRALGLSLIGWVAWPLLTLALVGYAIGNALSVKSA